MCTCTGDIDCKPGESCVDGICQPDNFCPPMMDLQYGKCCPDLDDDTYYGEDGICPLETDCDDSNPLINPGLAAETTKEGAAACSDNKDNDCDGLKDCADADCTSVCGGCTNDNQCPAGQVCTTGGTCGPCTSKADCDKPTEECVSGQCVECGNLELEPGEECDDGNTISGDGCSSTCQYELTLKIIPSKVVPYQQVKFEVKEIALGYYTDNVINICKNAVPTGCDGNGGCTNPATKLVCSYNTALGQTSCVKAAQAFANLGFNTLWACTKETSEEKNSELLQVVQTCGDGICSYGESYTCPDCYSGTCGNGLQELGENCGNCPSDAGCPPGKTCNGDSCSSGIPPGASPCTPCCGSQECGNDACCGTSCGECLDAISPLSLSPPLQPSITFCNGYLCTSMPTGSSGGCDPPQCFGGTCVEWYCQGDPQHPPCTNNCCGNCPPPGGGGPGYCGDFTVDQGEHCDPPGEQCNLLFQCVKGEGCAGYPVYCAADCTCPDTVQPGGVGGH